jgi:hypothetical protein
MKTNPKGQMPGPAETPGQKRATTKAERKIPTADAADTHTRRRDEVQLPPFLKPVSKPKET